MSSKSPDVEILAKKFDLQAGALFGLKKAAALTGFSEKTLSRAIALRRLHVYRPGGKRILMTSQQLAEWVVDFSPSSKRKK